KAYVSEEGASPRSEKAVTRFQVIQRGKACDLVECELETGRKNQIRIHMAHLGHPVAGDLVYGAENAVFSRYGLALHARVFAFTHPFSKESLRFEVPEPDFFRILLSVQTANTLASDKSRAEIAKKAEYSRVSKRGRGQQGSKYIPKK
ncbi:MAG: hypothetical protein LBU99_00195, partial [Spirochaetaceae bacterium]|nr:hypothetical protein [Spirochaetaceae bacterium]